MSPEPRVRAAEESLKAVFPAQEYLRREVARNVLAAADEAEGRETPPQGNRLPGSLGGFLLGLGLSVSLSEIHHIHLGWLLLITIGATLLGMARSND